VARVSRVACSEGLARFFDGGGAVNNKPTDPFNAFNFRVEIEGLLVGGFSECSGLQVDIEIEEYMEGGLNEYVHRFAGRTKYPPLVLKRGLTTSDTLWKWHQDVISGQFTRKNGTIYLLNTMRVPIIWWNFKNAIPTKLPSTPTPCETKCSRSSATE